jgi:hypothetical protein
MRRLTVDEIGDIHKPLLNPTPENVLLVTAQLERLAGEIAGIRTALDRGDGGRAGVTQFFVAVQDESRRVRALLDNAARLFSGLTATAEVAGYERHGFVYKAEVPRRALARL